LVSVFVPVFLLGAVVAVLTTSGTKSTSAVASEGRGAAVGTMRGAGAL
jgi:hypothetical protein